MTDLVIASEGEIKSLKSQADILVKSGLLPASVNTAEKAIVIMLKGRELGISPMQALSGINVISGKPCMTAELMLSQIYKNCKSARIHLVERTNEKCVIVASRPDCKSTEFIFTIEDAKRAGLMRNPSWEKYPRAMLHARCVSEMARSMFPDAIAGASYTPEEMGAEVNESGEVINVVPTEGKTDPTTTAETVSEIFIGAPDQHDKIEAVFAKRNLKKELWEQAKTKMVGRPGKDVGKVIKEVEAQQ